jgi:hypothetical protein
VSRVLGVKFDPWLPSRVVYEWNYTSICLHGVPMDDFNNIFYYLSNQATPHAHCSLLEYIALKISGDSYKYECPKFSVVLARCKIKLFLCSGKHQSITTCAGLEYSSSISYLFTLDGCELSA